MADRSAALLESWRRRRDGSAFEDLVRPELGRALGLARSLGCGAEDAEDAVQDALARLAAERGDDPLRVGVRPWFFRAVRDAARCRLRGEGRRRRRERAAAVPEALPGDEARMALREQVERALRGLEAGDQEAVRLRFLQDLDYAEMAYVLGVTEGACRLRVHRAVGRLRLSLGVGAAALLAVLAHPAPAHAAVLVQGALAEAGVAGTASTGGLVLMTTTQKLAAGAVFAAAFAAAGAVGALTLSSPPAAGPAVATAPGPAAQPAPRPVDEPGTVVQVPVPSTTPAPSHAASAAPPADLDVRPDEVEFLREALRKERARREAARVLPEDGGLEVFRRVAEAGADPAPILGDFASFRSRVRTGGDVRRIAASGDPTRVNMLEAAGDAAVIEFGPGRFELMKEGEPWGSFQKPRKSLEIRGAGMDQTTVVVPIYDLVMVREGQALENLSIHDLTLVGTGGVATMIDIRGRTAAVLENVRLTDWIIAGYASPIGVMGEAYLGCKGCEFIGAGRGYGLSFRGRVLGVLEGCLFRNVESAVTGSGEAEGSVVRLQGCTFDGSAITDSRVMAGKKPGISIGVQGGSVRLGGPDATEEERKKKAGADYIASLEGVSFGPSVPTSTLEQMLAVSERVRLDPGESVVQVILLSAGEAGQIRYGARVRLRDSMTSRWTVIGADGTPLENDPRDPGGGGRPLPSDVLAQCLPMAEAVRKSGIPLSTSATNLNVNSNTGGEPLVDIRGQTGWPTYAVKAKTGEKYAEWK